MSDTKPDAEPLIEVAHLSKTFGRGRERVKVIHDITFSLYPGEFVTIVGPSGAGKTTLLRCIGGLSHATTGTVRMQGREVVGPATDLAFVFQDYTRSLMPWLTVEANVELPLQNKVRDKRDRRNRVADALARVGLEKDGRKYPWQLSGGMQQRVALARGLAYEPSVLLMDEPFGSVDAYTRAGLEDLTLQVHAETRVSILLVTHDIDEAVYLADRVVVVSRGPTEVRECIEVNLPRPRDQVTTKSEPQFVTVRRNVMKQIFSARSRPRDHADRNPADALVTKESGATHEPGRG